MNIRNIESNLKMQDLFFSKCVFEREKDIASGEYKVDLEKQITEIKEHTYDVELRLTVDKEDFHLLIVTNAKFLYQAEDYGNEKIIINKNTVAIMFPFIRSQVSLMTTQPGMMPIVLPPINTAKLNQ